MADWQAAAERMQQAARSPWVPYKAYAQQTGESSPIIGRIPKVPGQAAFDRPIVLNPDGSTSSERIVGMEFEGRETPVPTIFGGKQVSPDEAVAILRAHHWCDPDTGEMIPSYGSRQEAEQAEAVRHGHLDRLSQGPGALPQRSPSGEPLVPETIRGTRKGDYGWDTPETFWSRKPERSIEAVPFGDMADPVSQLALMLAPQLLPALKGLRAPRPAPGSQGKPLIPHYQERLAGQRGVAKSGTAAEEIVNRRAGYDMEGRPLLPETEWRPGLSAGDRRPAWQQAWSERSPYGDAGELISNELPPPLEPYRGRGYDLPDHLRQHPIADEMPLRHELDAIVRPQPWERSRGPAAPGPQTQIAPDKWRQVMRLYEQLNTREALTPEREALRERLRRFLDL